MGGLLTVTTEMPSAVKMGAVLDEENHRYILTRTWDESTPSASFAMLNPSKADHRLNDPTILRCMRFAWLWGYGGIVVVNLFGFRTSKPRELLALDYAAAVGEQNDRYISQAVAETTLTVVSWGNDGAWNDRDRDVLDLIRAHTKPMCLGLTKYNMPLHPSARGKYRVPDDVKLRPYEYR
jgi:hypothetical protein